MSSRRSETALHIEPRASRRLALIMGAPYLLTLAVLPWITIPWWLAILIAFLVLAAARESLRRHAWRTAPERIAVASWLPSGGWAVTLATGERFSARLVGVPFVLPQMVIVELRLESGRRAALVLVPGMAPADVMRRLRIRLRHLDAAAQPSG